MDTHTPTPTPAEIGRLKSGEKVLLAGHLHEGICPLISEVLGQVSADANFIRREVNLGRIVGETNLVPTHPGDEVVFGRREFKGSDGEPRNWYSRLVRNRVPAETPLVSVVLARHKEVEGAYALLTAFFGELAPREPGDPSLNPEGRAEALAFWGEGKVGRFALIYGADPLQPGSEGEEIPVDFLP
jgi:hypothetical protein